jgi:alpha-L-arabinofuranosidase
MCRARYSLFISTFFLVLVLLPGEMGAQGKIVATIDATRTGAPIPKLSYGGFMEPATTQVWAEMLSDRKFAYPISSRTDAPEPAAPMGGGRRNPWRPVGGDTAVVMDTQNPYVGDQTPVVKTGGTSPAGLSQSGLALRSGKDYTGRIVIAGDPGVRVEVSLVWGPNPGDRQSVPIAQLTRDYVKAPLRFTARGDTDEGRVEITGTGSGSFHIGAVSLMPADNIQGYRAGMIKYLKEMGLTIARWPGGNFVSAYDWRDAIGDPDKRPPRIGPVRPTLESNDVGIDEFIAMCRLLDAEPYVAVNSGFGEARSAADLVEYTNGSRQTPMGRLRAENGHPEPYKVKYWGIGNEMYGIWQYGHMPLYQYWVKHAMFTKAMKKVDPTILVTASGATVEETAWCDVDIRTFQAADWNKGLTEPMPYQKGSEHDWSGGLLANAADSIDMMAEHYYSYPDLRFNPETGKWMDTTDPLELAVRKLPNKLVCKYTDYAEYNEKIPGLKDRKIPFAFDEWGARLRSVSGRQGEALKTTLSNALAYHEMFRHTDSLGMVILTGGFRTPLTDATGDAVGLRVDGLMFKLLRHHLYENLPLAVGGNSPQQPTPGTVGVDQCQAPSGSPTFPLDVFAAISQDRKTLTISIINPTLTAQELTLNVIGVQPGKTGRLWQIVAPSVSAANVAGQKPLVDLTESPATYSGSVKVPAISFNVYEFDVTAR